MTSSVKIRMAAVTDVPALLKIYAPYVLNTSVSFEYAVPTVEEFTSRVENTLKTYPYLVAEADGGIVGYAYAARFHPRAAYAWTAEASIYVSPDYHKMGIGRALYAELERILRLQNVYTLNACISHANPDSEEFHRRLGFRQVAFFEKTAFKFGSWESTVWMSKALSELPEKPEPFIPVTELCITFQS